MFRKMKAITILAVLIGLSLALQAVAASVEVAVDGEARAVIVHNGYEQQAGELQQFLKQITSAELQSFKSVDEAPEGMDIIALQVLDKVPGTSDYLTANHAYRLHVGDGQLTISAQTELGIDYAVYGLLQDHLGVGFYSEIYTHIPDRPTLVVSDLDELMEPAFYHRNPMHQPWSVGEETRLYARRNRQFPPNGAPWNAGHNFRKFGTWEHCPLDPEFHKELGEKLKKSFAEWDSERPMPLGQMDGAFHFGCGKCEKCEAMVEEEGSEAAPMLVMLNAAMEIAEEEYPDHEIITFAYWNTLKVPKTIRPHKNIWIQVVSSDASANQGGDHLGTIRNNPANRLYEHAIREWPKAHPGRVTTWHWATGNSQYEWPNLFNHIDDIRLMYESGVNGLQQQTSSGVRSSAWSELKFWVWHQLSWKPERDENELIDRFLREFYGEKAAPHLREYLETADRIRGESGYYAPGGQIRWFTWPINMRRKFLNRKAVEELSAILDRALEAAAQEGNPVYAEHVAHAATRALDAVVIDSIREAEGFKRVENPADGTPWYVPGGREDMPARIERIMPNDRRRQEWLKRRAGGRIYEVTAGELRADVVPNYRGRIVSLVHQPSGSELFAGEGYTEQMNTRHQIHQLQDATPQRVQTEVQFGGGYWAWGRPEQMEHTIEAAPEGNGLVIKRQFRRGSTVAHGRWEVRMPNPYTTRVRVHGAGIDATYAGRELLMRTEAIIHQLADADEDEEIVVEIDRGDGFVIELKITANGWRSVQLLPDIVSTAAQHDMNYHLLDAQITPEGEMEIAAEGDYDWRRQGSWPADYEVWPNDPSTKVRVFFQNAGTIDDDGTLPEQRIMVRTDGERRKAEAPPAVVRNDDDRPRALRRRGPITARRR